MTRAPLEALPAASVLAGTAVLGLAALSFPGGYHWADHTVSALLQPVTPSGVTNSARPLAVWGVVTVMIGIAVLFQLVSSRTTRSWHRRAIQIGGIASTVFAALTATTLHDLMVVLALVGFVIALGAILHALYVDRAFPLFILGILSVTIELSTAMLYFGQVFLEYLPALQKAALGLIGLWLFAIQYRSNANSGATRLVP